MSKDEKDAIITARVTNLSKETLRRIAARLGVSMADVLEMALRGELDLQAEVDKERQLKKEPDET